MTFRWWADGGPFWLLDIGFLRNTGTDPGGGGGGGGGVL